MLFVTLPAAEAAFCKTLKGEWVGVGTDGPTREAQSRLDKALADWGKHYSIAPVKPKDRRRRATSTCRSSTNIGARRKPWCAAEPHRRFLPARFLEAVAARP
jgi:hypothetical protein